MLKRMVEWISFFFFALAALIHLGFFIFESIVLQRPNGHRWLKINERDFVHVKLWAFNQGFYNLFLSLGMILGLSFVLKLQVHLAGVMTGFCSISMLAAGTVLWFSAPRLRKMALVQAVPPLLGLIFIFFHISKHLS
jgi:putative membrane protein